MLEFLFLLARELGKTVGQLLDELGEGELALWYEIHKRQPLGNSWYQTALICSTVANFNPWGIKRALKPEDFMPKVRKPLTAAQAKEAFLLAMVGLGVKVVPKAQAAA